MKHRNIMAVILLSIITLGIYDVYWLVKTKKVLNEQTDVHTPSIWLLFAPVLALVVLVPVSLLMPHVSDGTTAVSTIVGILVGMLAVLGVIPITFYWFFKFSKAVGKYTHGEVNTAMAMLLLWLLRFIGIAVIQDAFNDVTARGGAAPTVATTGFGAGAPMGMAGQDSEQPIAPEQPVGPGQSYQPEQPQDTASQPPEDSAPQPPVTPPRNLIQ